MRATARRCLHRLPGDGSQGQHTAVFISRSLRTADSQAFLSGDFNLSPHEILEEAIAKAKVVHTSAWALSLEPCRSAVFKAFDLASTKGKIVSFDPTMGSGGILLSHAGKISHIPARKVEAVDATGAGEAFWAGFIVAFLDGKSLRQSILFAREIVEHKLTTTGPLPDNMDRNDFYKKIEEKPKSRRAGRTSGEKKPEPKAE